MNESAAKRPTNMVRLLVHTFMFTTFILTVWLQYKYSRSRIMLGYTARRGTGEGEE